MTEFNKRLVLKAAPLLIVSLAMFFSSLPGAEATVVKDLRIGNNNGYIRMVIEFDRPPVPPPTVSLHQNTVQVTLAGIVNDVSPSDAGEKNNGIVSLDVTKESEATRIDAVFSFAPADVKAFSLTSPHRFIVDAYRPVTSTPPVRRPIEKTSRISDIEAPPSLPEPYRAPGEPNASGISGTVAQASINANGSAPSASPDTSDVHKNRFKQLLIAALIGVTSIIAVLLFFLMWMGSTSQHPREPSWIDRLPPTKDPTIENIDAVIRKHLKNNNFR